MVQYHASRNELDPTWCLSQVLKSATDQSADVLLLSDLRTLADLEYFQLQSAAAFHRGDSSNSEPYSASDDARAARGWQSDDTKDLLPTEVELDSFTGWTMCVDNSDNSELGAGMLNHWVQMTGVPRILGA